MLYNKVGIREAKANLSKLLRMVQRGHEVILTDRGKPVGKMVPIQGEPTLEERIRKLEESGILEPQPPKRLSELPKPIALPHGIAQDMLQQDRGNGR